LQIKKTCQIKFDENDNDSGLDFVRVDCESIPEAQWAQIGALIEQGCKKAEHWNGEKARFQKEDFGK
jgi:hypothetical protein